MKRYLKNPDAGSLDKYLETLDERLDFARNGMKLLKFAKQAKRDFERCQLLRHTLSHPRHVEHLSTSYDIKIIITEAEKNNPRLTFRLRGFAVATWSPVEARLTMGTTTTTVSTISEALTKVIESTKARKVA